MIACASRGPALFSLLPPSGSVLHPVSLNRCMNVFPLCAHRGHCFPTDRWEIHVQKKHVSLVMCRFAKILYIYIYIYFFFLLFKQKKNYDRVMKALDSITSIRELTQVSTSSVVWMFPFCLSKIVFEKCLRARNMPEHTGRGAKCRLPRCRGV